MRKYNNRELSAFLVKKKKQKGTLDCYEYV
jgi:hypothetical protein